MELRVVAAEAEAGNQLWEPVEAVAVATAVVATAVAATAEAAMEAEETEEVVQVGEVTAEAGFREEEASIQRMALVAMEAAAGEAARAAVAMEAEAREVAAREAVAREAVARGEATVAAVMGVAVTEGVASTAVEGNSRREAQEAKGGAVCIHPLGLEAEEGGARTRQEGQGVPAAVA